MGGSKVVDRQQEEIEFLNIEQLDFGKAEYDVHASDFIKTSEDSRSFEVGEKTYVYNLIGGHTVESFEQRGWEAYFARELFPKYRPAQKDIDEAAKLATQNLASFLPTQIEPAIRYVLGLQEDDPIPKEIDLAGMQKEFVESISNPRARKPLIPRAIDKSTGLFEKHGLDAENAKKVHDAFSKIMASLEIVAISPETGVRPTGGRRRELNMIGAVAFATSVAKKTGVQNLEVDLSLNHQDVYENPEKIKAELDALAYAVSQNEFNPQLADEIGNIVLLVDSDKREAVDRIRLLTEYTMPESGIDAREILKGSFAEAGLMGMVIRVPKLELTVRNDVKTDEFVVYDSGDEVSVFSKTNIKFFTDDQIDIDKKRIMQKSLDLLVDEGDYGAYALKPYNFEEKEDGSFDVSYIRVFSKEEFELFGPNAEFEMPLRFLTEPVDQIVASGDGRLIIEPAKIHTEEIKLEGREIGAGEFRPIDTGLEEEELSRFSIQAGFGYDKANQRDHIGRIEQNTNFIFENLQNDVFNNKLFAINYKADKGGVSVYASNFDRGAISFGDAKEISTYAYNAGLSAYSEIARMDGLGRFKFETNATILAPTKRGADFDEGIYFRSGDQEHQSSADQILLGDLHVTFEAEPIDIGVAMLNMEIGFRPFNQDQMADFLTKQIGGGSIRDEFRAVGQDIDIGPVADAYTQLLFPGFLNPDISFSADANFKYMPNQQKYWGDYAKFNIDYMPFEGDPTTIRLYGGAINLDDVHYSPTAGMQIVRENILSGLNVALEANGYSKTDGTISYGVSLSASYAVNLRGGEEAKKERRSSYSPIPRSVRGRIPKKTEVVFEDEEAVDEPLQTEDMTDEQIVTQLEQEVEDEAIVDEIVPQKISSEVGEEKEDIVADEQKDSRVVIDEDEDTSEPEVPVAEVVQEEGEVETVVEQTPEIEKETVDEETGDTARPKTNTRPSDNIEIVEPEDRRRRRRSEEIVEKVKEFEPAPVEEEKVDEVVQEEGEVETVVEQTPEIEKETVDEEMEGDEQDIAMNTNLEPETTVEVPLGTSTEMRFKAAEVTYSLIKDDIQALVNNDEFNINSERFNRVKLGLEVERIFERHEIGLYDAWLENTDYQSFFNYVGLCVGLSTLDGLPQNTREMIEERMYGIYDEAVQQGLDQNILDDAFKSVR